MSKTRIHLIDELRGLCVLLMVVYHAFYTVGYVFGVEAAVWLFKFFIPVEPIFAGIFVFLCGFSCRLSKSNLKRGLLLAVVAVGMSAVLWIVMPDQMIWFGILHCLSVCILAFVLLKPLLDRIPPLVGLIAMAVLLLLTWNLPFYNGGYLGIKPLIWETPTEWEVIPWLVPLGITPTSSADLFPIIPWLFCFLAGSFVGQWKDRLPAFTKKRHMRPLAFLGRHSLIIYLAHQPIIYGITYAIERITA